MTIHSAKGLEFPIVFLAGAEEGIFPGMASINNPEEMSEERRLAYVAITRAKKKLFVTSASERLMYGSTQYHRPSRFIAEEIPASLKEKTVPERPAFAQATYTAPTRREPAPIAGSSEFARRTTVTTPPRRPASTPAFAAGDRVKHLLFGMGTILSVRPMGGDTLYEIRFDNGATKKLMATYAKLTKV